MLMSLLCALAVSANANAPRIETLTLTSKVFGNTRTIRVLLPPGYDDEQRAYPVLYLNDGQMVFRALASEGIEIQSLLLPPVIIVGIDNGIHDARADELLPYPDAGFSPSRTWAPHPAAPHGKLYPSFLVDELIPAIKQRYRVLKGPENSGIGGFSYGGIAALYAVIARPGVFGKLMIESTPLWIGENRKLLRDARKFTAWPSRVYAGVGTAESRDADVNAEWLQDIRALMEIIRERSPSAQLNSVVERGAHHATAAWRRRLPAAVEFLFTSQRQQ